MSSGLPLCMTELTHYDRFNLIESVRSFGKVEVMLTLLLSPWMKAEKNAVNHLAIRRISDFILLYNSLTQAGKFSGSIRVDLNFQRILPPK
jgi:hypothetical protein